MMSKAMPFLIGAVVGYFLRPTVEPMVNKILKK